jgi:hypothetical protein
MQPVTVTVAGAGNSSPVVLDYLIAPFQVSVGVTVTGAVAYTLQYTYDDPQASGGITNWFDSPLMLAETAAADTVLNGGPVTAVRLVNADTGTIVGRIVQAGR